MSSRRTFILVHLHSIVIRNINVTFQKTVFSLECSLDPGTMHSDHEPDCYQNSTDFITWAALQCTH